METPRKFYFRPVAGMENQRPLWRVFAAEPKDPETDWQLGTVECISRNRWRGYPLEGGEEVTKMTRGDVAIGLWISASPGLRAMSARTVAGAR